MERIYTVKLDNGASYQARGDEALALTVHEPCVVRKDFYFDFATVTRVGVELESGKGAEMPAIQRRPNEIDLKNVEDNRARCRGAMRSAQEMVEHLALPMKLLNAHYSLDGKLLTIQFTAEGRVDFRELVKELSRALNTRIELRQIGVRDESAIHGGISVCGQVLCCCRFLKEFNSINVRMAKDQDLSLTPATISGVCGRLKCCLKFEHEGYLELEKTMPRRGDWCECPGGRGRIADRNLLTQEVTVALEGGNLTRFPRSEVKVVPPDKNRLAAPRRDRNNDRGERNNDRGGDRNNDRNGNNGGAEKPRNPEGGNRGENGGNGKRRDRRDRDRDRGPRPPRTPEVRPDDKPAADAAATQPTE